MWVILAFWLFLPVPGFAWLSRYDPQSLEGGALSTLGRSYLASFAMLTPISVLGYIFHWPVAGLALVYLAIVVAGVASLIHKAPPRPPPGRPELRVIAVLGTCVLLFDLWLGARVGSHVIGDAAFHVARARMLIAHGLGSWDPVVADLRFEPTYHTNLYHALLATSAWLGSVDPGTAWIWVWPFAKLALATASYELALQVLGDRRYAWVAAIGASAWFATQSVLPYPNTLAPFAFLTAGLAMIVAAVSGESSFRKAAWVAVAGLIIAQTHMLYASFFVLVASPVLALRFAWALLRRGPGRAQLFATLLCLGAPVPWLAVPALPRLTPLLESTAQAQAQPTAPARPRPVSQRDRKAGMFIDAGDGKVHMNPNDFLRPDLAPAQLLAALALFAVLSRRAGAAAALAIEATALAWVLIPLLCTALIKLLTAPWIAVRFTTLFDILTMALLPATCVALVGTLAALLARKLHRPAWIVTGSVALQLAGCGAALVYAYRLGPRGEPWTLERTWEAARTNQAAVHAQRIDSRARFFASAVPERASVMAPEFMDYELPMHCDCSAFAFRRGRGKREVPDIVDRRAAARRFYDHGTPGAERAEIVRRYGLRYVYSSVRRSPRLAADLDSNQVKRATESPDAIIELPR